MSKVYRRLQNIKPESPAFSAIEDNGLPPALFIHGFLSSRAQWHDNIAGLSQFCRPIFVELFGHGRSPTPKNDSAYAIKDYLSAFEETREYLNIEHWPVIGQSFGAGLALHYGLKFPEAVSSVVFTNSLSAIGKKEDMPGGSQGEAIIKGVQTGGLEFLEKLPFHTNKIKNCSEAARSEFGKDSQRLSPAGIVKTMTLSTQGLNVRERLSKISAPICLINGVRERKFQPVRDWLSDHFSEIVIVDLDGGHSPNVECAEEFNKSLKEFILKL